LADAPEIALKSLEQQGVVTLDEEKKAAMVNESVRQKG